MGLFANIKLILKIRKPVSNIIKEATNVKPGYKTTEFWITVISNLITIVGAVQGMIDPKIAAIILAVLNGLYNLMRGLVKSNTPETPPQA